ARWRNAFRTHPPATESPGGAVASWRRCRDKPAARPRAGASQESESQAAELQDRVARRLLGGTFVDDGLKDSIGRSSRRAKRARFGALATKAGNTSGGWA